MGCFGDMEPVKNTQATSTSTSSPPAWVEAAGKENYELARSILDTGYQPYSGTRVAPLSADEQTAAGMVRTAAATPNAYLPEIEANLRAGGAAPAHQFNYDDIAKYISPYLMQVLDPTLRQISEKGNEARKGIDSSAIMSGAFGDARHGVVEGAQRRDENQLVADTSAKAFQDAFLQALDTSFKTQQAQASEDRAALDRVRTSGIDLSNLDKSEISRKLGLASALGGAGEAERALTQRQADVDYEDFKQKTGGFTNQEIAYLTSILSGTPMTVTKTGTEDKTESRPNNSGWQAVGSIASALLPSAIAAL